MPGGAVQLEVSTWFRHQHGLHQHVTHQQHQQINDCSTHSSSFEYVACSTALFFGICGLTGMCTTYYSWHQHQCSSVVCKCVTALEAVLGAFCPAVFTQLVLMQSMDVWQCLSQKKQQLLLILWASGSKPSSDEKAAAETEGDAAHLLLHDCRHISCKPEASIAGCHSNKWDCCVPKAVQLPGPAM